MSRKAGDGIRDWLLFGIIRDNLERQRVELGLAPGRYDPDSVRIAAGKLGVHAKTLVQNLNGLRRPRKRFALSERDKARVLSKAGDVRKAHRSQVAANECTVSYATFLRAFDALPPAEQAFIRGGTDALNATLPFLKLVPPSGRGELYDIDHGLFKLVTLYDPITRRRGHPWITPVGDAATGVLVGFSVTLGTRSESNGVRSSVSTESAFAALADAFVGRDYDGVFIGGVPDGVRFDQGSDFMGPVAEALAHLDIGSVPCEANHPQGKGMIEGLIGILKKHLVDLPGYGLQLDEEAA